jgi:hypothetical protein
LVATQLLRAAAVGGLLDARLELNTYHLLRELGEPFGPWIGADITLREQSAANGLLSADDVTTMLTSRESAAFSPPESGDASDARFLEVRIAEASEIDARGQVLGRATLEYAVPRPTSSNTLSALPVLRAAGQLYVGLELRELPAVQAFTGRSRFTANPAWRLPRSVENLAQAEAFLIQQLSLHFGARALRTWPLGGKYYPATGATPEVVYPLLVEVDGQSVQYSTLSFVPLAALWQGRRQIEDGHLLIAMWRLAHAAGLLDPSEPAAPPSASL